MVQKTSETDNQVTGAAHKSHFGITLRLYRMERKLSQIQLAEQIGISSRNLQRIERGELEPGLLTIIAAAKTLGIQPHELIEFEHDPSTAKVLSLEEAEKHPHFQEVQRLAAAMDELIEDVGIEGAFSSIKERREFYSSSIPISISNFFNFFINTKAVSVIAPADLSAERIYPTGSTYKSRRETVAILNTVIGHDKVYWTSVNEHIIGAAKIELESLGYFRQSEDHFLNIQGLTVLSKRPI